MIYNESDIIVRRERSKRQAVWIIQSVVLAMLDMSVKALSRNRSLFKKTVANHRRKQSIMPDTGASWRWAKMNGTFYYDYDRLPAPRREVFGSKEDVLAAYEEDLKKDRTTPLTIAIQNSIIKGYESYLPLYNDVPHTKAKQLARAAATLMTAIHTIEEDQIDTTKMTFFHDLASIIKQNDIGYLPKNHRRIKEKILSILDGTPICEVIHLPRKGNVNAVRVEDKQLISWLIQLRRMPQNYTNSYIIRKVRTLCSIRGKHIPSTSWCENYLATNAAKFLTVDRFGSMRRADRERGYVNLVGAVHAGDCWMADGTRVNFVGHHGKEGKTEFLYMIVISDVYSGHILGVHFDTKEDRWGYLHAFKMAANHCGYLPYEFVADKFPGHNTQEWKTLSDRMTRLGVKMTTTPKKTGKAKAERLFSTLQTVFMQDSPMYYGEGVQSRNEHAHRAPEYLKQITKALKKKNWDFTAAWTETMKIIDAYRDTKLSEYSRKYATVEMSPREMHNASEKPNVVKIEPWDYIELFGAEKKVTLRNMGMIVTEIQRVKYTYVVNDYELIKHHKGVRLCYDMDDLTIVHLWENTNDINRKYLGQAVEQRGAELYGPNADMSDLGKYKKRIKHLEEMRKAEADEICEAYDEVALLMPQFVDKNATASAETRMLAETIDAWQDTGKPRLLNQAPPPTDDTELDEPDVNPLSQL